MNPVDAGVGIFTVMIFLAFVALGIFLVARAVKSRKHRMVAGYSGTRIEEAPRERQPAADTGKTTEPPTETKPATAGIFLCYRRSDSADAAGRIYDRLVAQYGKEAVFKDVDSIPLGVDFRSAIATTIERCSVLLAVIGPDWGDKTKAGDRLEDPRDHVRIEIEAALHREIPVIPILVRGAAMPAEGDLPEKLCDLAYRNGISVRADPDFHQDVSRLIAGVDEHLAHRFSG